MTAQKNKGLARAKELYQDRSIRAKELKAEGKKVMGYFCLYPVLELFTAFDIVPYRILGDMGEPITKADSCLPTIVCPFIRSALDLGLKGRYDFFDGVVMCHSCEVGEKAAHIWRIYMNPSFYHFLDTPHTVHKNAQDMFKEQILDFQKSLEKFTGKGSSREKIKDAVKICNEQRTLVRELYDLRKADPPLILGAEIIEIMVALMSIPVVEGNALLKEVISDVKGRTDGPKKKRPRGSSPSTCRPWRTWRSSGRATSPGPRTRCTLSIPDRHDRDAFDFTLVAGTPSASSPASPSTTRPSTCTSRRAPPAVAPPTPCGASTSSGARRSQGVVAPRRRHRRQPGPHGRPLYVGTNAGTVVALELADNGATMRTYATSDGPVKGYIWPEWGTSNLYFSTTDTVWSLADPGTGSSLTKRWDSGSTVPRRRSRCC